MEEIKTDRLVLRRARPEDAEALCQIRNTEYVMKYNGMKEEPLEKIREQVQKDSGSDRAFYLEGRESGALVGAVWLREDPFRHKVPAVLLAYFLGEEFAGKGLMTEALRAVLPYAFSNLQAEVVSAQVFAGNIGSERVLEKLGFQREGVMRRAVLGQGDIVYDTVLFSLLREEWERQGKTG